VGKKTEQVLTDLGIRIIGQIARMPLPALKSHFGVFGDMLYHRANGIDNSPVTSPEEAKSISREPTLEEDTPATWFSCRLRYVTRQRGLRIFGMAVNRQNASRSKQDMRILRLSLDSGHCHN